MHLLILSVIVIGFALSPLFSELMEWSKEAHNFCLDSAPDSSQWKNFYQAIVCGKKLRADPHWQQMKNLGMVHILVISGAHLVFLSQILKLLFFRRLSESIEGLLLLPLVVVCQFQPPALRAWCYLFMIRANKKHKLFFKPAGLLLVTIVFCLVIHPGSLSSTSLALSWLACLGIGLGKNSFSRSFFCFLLLQPILIQWGAPSPLTIAINALVTPLVGMILFPSSLLCFFIPKFNLLVDFLWEFLFHCTQIISPSLTPLESKSFMEKKIWIWLYALTINLILIHWENRKDEIP